MDTTEARKKVEEIMEMWAFAHKEPPWIQRVLIREMVREAYLAGFNDGVVGEREYNGGC